MEIKAYLKSKQRLIFDGAFGTMLQQKGLKSGEIPEEVNFTNPQWIREIHQAYLKAGAQVLTTNTFGANRYKLAHASHSVAQSVKQALDLALAVRGEKENIFVAQDLGPIGQLLAPSGNLSFDEAYDMYKEQVLAGEERADLFILETISDLHELKAAVLAVKENSNLPIFCTMTFEKNGRTFNGTSLESLVLVAQGLGVDAVGINCSYGPEELLPLMERLAQISQLPLMIQPNAGLPDPQSGAYSLTAEDYGAHMVQFARLGVQILGGCCGTTPEYIQNMVANLKAEPLSAPQTQPYRAAVCTPSEVVWLDQARIIGERINPTGKKRFKEALINHDIDYILKQAIEQTHAGAEILDVNVGLPDIDETAMMKEVVQALQSITNAPLQLDSTDPAVLEQALRIYNGKAIVNSVNGEEGSLKAILPLVKKYGASVVGLTLDEKGIPPTCEGRFLIAEKIVNTALSYGIPKEDIFIDCLTLTVSAEQEGAVQTLKALEMVKNRLGVKTVLGVSNISFGLPNRGLVNHTFLAMALERGLDLAIINPNVAEMTGVIRAFRVLKGYDANSTAFIKNYANTSPAAANITPEKKDDLPQLVRDGLKKEAENKTKELLQSMEPLAIINEILIPTLDSIGKDFETGTIFLPQLIISAECAGVCFDILKAEMKKTAQNNEEKGKIVLATVKGDIHDIGKNIVKVLLENYGYTIIDLGRDVPPEKIVQTTIEQKVPLVGLSALMTTTLGSMAQTIALLHENQVPCKVMVGGAVLTADYAQKIGADYYSKDASESVRIAKKVIG